MARERRAPAPVAFLLLGETLLVPHILPIAGALARLRPDLAIDLWMGDAEVETLVGDGPGANVRLRRAPGFGRRRDAPLAKPAMLARLLPKLAGVRVAVCAEQTSLWLPTLLPLRTRFIKTSHGAGSMSARDDRRRRAAWRMLVPGELERQAYLDRGFPAEQVIAIGYVKASFPAPARHRPAFDAARPTIVYAPHWQRHRSSWWAWGREIVAMLAAQRHWNVILAPHQRLAEKDPDVRRVLAQAAALPHVQAGVDPTALIDGSYLRAADLYLGDTSSQVVEYLVRPRPCVFLDPAASDWRAAGDHGFWECGEVVTDLALLPAALARAHDRHPGYAATQRALVAAALGDTGPRAPVRAAEVVLQALGEPGAAQSASQDAIAAPRRRAIHA